MPIDQPEDLQLSTFKTASDLAAKLTAIGIACGTIYEILENGEKNDTTAENWEDNHKRHQYVCTIWGGPEQSLPMTQAMFDQNGYTYDSFSHLAAISNVAPVEPAIIALKGVVDGINRVLHHGMK